MNETAILTEALQDLSGDGKAVQAWLREPNKAFGGETPLEAIRCGEADLLWEMIHQIRQGEYA